MRVSVIIPVFKVEDYLAACLDSILSQGFAPGDCEIIVINDGSPDNSLAIARDYAAKHPEIIVIDQKNQGVSVARTAGLDKASGKFIAFIDPDDTIHPNSLKPIVERAEKDDIDVLYLSLEVFDEAGNFLYQAEKNGDDDIVKDGITHPRRTYLSTLYKRSAIGDVRFKPGIIRGQDTVFNAMVQSKAKRVSYCSIPYYKYLQRESSSRQFLGTERNFQSCLLAMETLNDFRKAHFPSQSAAEKLYFDNAILIFVQRTLEWNIWPQSNAKNFNLLKARLRELGLGYLIAVAAERFPMFDKPFAVFMGYRKLKGFYHGVMNKFARK